jgi:hypothetical protein
MHQRPAFEAPRHGARERQDLAELASQALGIPRALALRLAERYLSAGGPKAGFLAWIGRPAA